MHRTPHLAALAALVLIFAAVGLAGCDASGAASGGSSPGRQGAGSGAAAPPVTTAPSTGTTVAPPVELIMETNRGAIGLELYPDKAPVTVANFVKLVEAKFYDGILIHRVEPGFVVQAGDPQTRGLSAKQLAAIVTRQQTGARKEGDPLIGTGGPGWTIPLETSSLTHDRGVIAMARSQDPDSAGSQFYITLGAAHQLDGQYAVFGKVTTGMDIVDRLTVGDRIVSVRVTKE